MVNWESLLRGEEADPAALHAALERADEQDLDALLDLARHPDPRVREALALSLPGLRPDHPVAPRVVDCALRLSADPIARVRDWACFALGRQWPEVDNLDVRAALRARLTDEDTDTRGEALIGLALRHDDAALPAALLALRGPDEELRRLATLAAGALRDPDLHTLVREQLIGWQNPDDERIAQLVARLTDPAGPGDDVLEGVALLYHRRAHGRPDGDAVAAWHQMNDMLDLAPHRAREFLTAVLAHLQNDPQAQNELRHRSALSSMTST